MPLRSKFQCWDQNGSDAAAIVKEYIAERARRGYFNNFISGRQEWLVRYNEDTLKKTFARQLIDTSGGVQGVSNLFLCFLYFLDNLSLFFVQTNHILRDSFTFVACVSLSITTTVSVDKILTQAPTLKNIYQTKPKKKKKKKKIQKSSFAI